MRTFLIKLLGGFPDTDSAIQHIKDINDITAKRMILTEAVKHLFNTVGAEDILQFKDGQPYFEGKPMQPADYERIRAEAQELLGMKIWRVLKKDFQYHVNKKMFEDGRVDLDLVWGQLLLFYDDIIRTRIQKLK